MTLGGTAPDEERARERYQRELEAISRTPEFERATVMRRLLEFLVSETLAGRGDALKAYSVAVDGLGRDPDFDAQSDSYPRVQVGRLRKMLDAHYGRTAPADGVRLIIRTGGYRVGLLDDTAEGGNAQAAEVPTLAEDDLPPRRSVIAPVLSRGTVRRLLTGLVVLIAALAALIWLVLNWRDTHAPQRTTAQAPVLEIGALAASGGASAQALARATRVVLEDALYRPWLVRVRQGGNLSADVAELDRPAYRLTGNVDTTGLFGGAQITLTLADVRSGEQIWSRTIPAPAEGMTLPDALTPAIASLIGPFGAIATHQRGLVQPGGRPGYACLLDYDVYFRHRDPALRERVRACVTETVATEPMSASALAAASFLSLDPALDGGSPGALERASDYARRAVAANASSAEAQAADARVAFLSGQCTRGRMISDRAVQLNPYNAEIIGLMGFLLFQCDDPRAAGLLQRALGLDPDVPTFYAAAYILALIERGDTAQAVQMADTIRPPGLGMSGQYEVARVIATSAQGNTAAARRHWLKAAEISGAPPADTDRVLAYYFYSPSFRTKLIRYLVAHGVVARAPARTR